MFAEVMSGMIAASVPAPSPRSLLRSIVATPRTLADRNSGPEFHLRTTCSCGAYGRDHVPGARPGVLERPRPTQSESSLTQHSGGAGDGECQALAGSACVW